MPNSAPDFTAKTMRQTDVISIISKLGGTTALEKINVKQRIRAARVNGLLGQSQNRNGRWWVNTKEFLDWAAQQKGWESLRTIPGISCSINIQVQGVSAAADVGNVFHSRHEAEIFALKAELSECKAELEKFKQRSMKAQEAGRIGGKKRKFSD